MKICIRLLLPIILASFLSSCAAVEVDSDYDKRTDFDSYKTFAFYKSAIDKVKMSDIDKENILLAVEIELLEKGYTKSEHPDFLVGIFAAAEEIDVIFNSDWNQYQQCWSANPHYDNTPHVRTQKKDAIYVNLFDASKKRVFWQGFAYGDISKKTEKKEKHIENFVNKIIKDFPQRNIK